MKWFYVIALLVAAGLALTPWPLLSMQERADYPTTFDGRPAVIRYDSYGAPVKSIDSATAGDTTSAGIQGYFYESLYTYHFLKRPAQKWVIPQLAAEMPDISDDGRTYTIRLKGDVRYHANPCFGVDADGRPKPRTVQAGDFALALKRCADYHVTASLAWALLADKIVGLDDWREESRDYPAGDFSRYDLPVEGIEVVDDLTLRITLTERYPQFIYVLAMNLTAPTPREAVDYWLTTAPDGAGGREPIPMPQRAAEFYAAEQTVGTGAYYLHTFRRKDLIVLVRNPQYRDVYYPREGEPGDRAAGLLDDAGKRVPFVDVVRLEFVPESYSAWMRFLHQQTDVSGIPRETFENVVTPGKELSARWRERHIYLSKYGSPAVYWIAFNMEDPVLGGSRSLRQALCLAYDVESHIKVLYNGRGRRAVNILPSSIYPHELAGRGPYYHLDMEAATEKLAEARKELAAKGLLEDGEIPQLTLDMAGRDARAHRFAEFVAQQFGKLGVQVKTVFNDWPTLQQKVDNKQTQMYTMGWHSDYPDAQSFLQLFYTPNIAQGTNNANYSNPVYDKLYEQIATMPMSPERTKMYVEMVNIVSEDVPVLLLSEPLSYVLYYDWVKNVKHHPFGYGYGKYVRIDTALREKLGGGR